MRKVIGKKLYDPTKAEKIAVYSNGMDADDPMYEEEALYLTASGNWFIFGQGGPSSSYACPIGNGRGGRDIRALPSESAKAWLVEREFDDLVLEHFGESFEDA